MPCDFMPRKKDCRSGYHKCVVPMVHYKREREREKSETKLFVFIYHAGINSFVFTAMHNFILHPGKAFGLGPWYCIQSEKSSLSSLFELFSNRFE